MGAVMKALQTKVAGRADGKTLSQEVQRQLGDTLGVLSLLMLSAIIVAAGQQSADGIR